MPFYRHECEACGHRFRVLELRGTESEEPKCPACGSMSTHRLMPLVAVQFKGSGYYKTDYGRRGGRSPRSSEGTGSSDSGNAKPSSDAKTSDDS